MPLPILLAIAAGLASPTVHKLATTHRVEFKAKKRVTKPVDVGFKTKDGKKVAFRAKKTVIKDMPIKFRAKNAKSAKNAKTIKTANNTKKKK